MQIPVNQVNQPNWRDINVHQNLPENLSKLQEIAYNLWWVWNSDAKNIFRYIDNEAWHRAQSNPIVLLNIISYDKLLELGQDKDFLAQLDRTYADFRAYMDEPRDSKRPSIAYFSMEYGLSHVLKIYSGGLGILAGDYLKEASDCNVDMTAIGFLYRYGYFTQTLSPEGQQIANYEAQNFSNLPVKQVLEADGSPMIIDVPYPGRVVHAYLWQVAVGRINLYLLDTDNDLNSEWDRSITHQLYGGDNENRLKQEIMLGIGGVLALNKLGISKDVYHCNEGHAALMGLQRLLDLIRNDKLSFNEALEVVRASGLYTCHTPVPAGHDYFDEGLLYKYLSEYPQQLGIEWSQLIGMGRQTYGDDQRFSMSVFALNTCQEANGVSWLHGEVSKKMFAPIWQGYFPDELHVSYVTNGVHMPTWTASEWKALYAKYFDPSHLADQSNVKIWEAIYNVPDKEIWETRMALKNKLFDYIKKQFKEDWLKHQGDPSRIVSILEKINPNALTIGFARRFATYKRAHLLFSDLDRLAKIVNNPNYPVQFLFAGKAHPADGAGQGLIKKIYEISRRPEFLGKIIFLEDYDFRLARRLVSGVDIWMNTPTRPLEASGTSGEKAEMNGVVNLSVLDGWWLEGYREGAGWALTEKRTYDNQGYQDQLDAATIYGLLENEIVPLYYDKNKDGYSEGWIKVIKNSIATIAPHYTMKRQLDDYYDKFYTKEANRFKKLSANNNQIAKEIALWKETVAERWDAIHVVSKENNMPATGPETGEEYKFTFVVDEQGLDNAIGLEFVALGKNEKGEDCIKEIHPFKVVKREGNLYTFECTTTQADAGLYKCAVRMYPKNDLLPHRQDFAYVKWFEY